MKIVKRIGLLVVYPLIMTIFGFMAGMWGAHYLYKLPSGDIVQEELPAVEIAEEVLRVEETEQDERQTWQNPDQEEKSREQEAEKTIDESLEVMNAGETLSVDTQYVLEEMDMLDGSSVETVWRIPAKYVGMNREQFLEAMELYEAFPPLSEQERGFVSLEVLSFSRERVVVQMNYRYVQPSAGFYLAVKDNEVVVYLEDAQTLYIETGISLDALPDTLQMEIMNMLWMEDEEELYDFLEAYSS